MSAPFFRRPWVLLLIVLSLSGGEWAVASEKVCKTVDCLANTLIKDIPLGETIALAPFGPPNTNIPLRVAENLHDSISSALYRRSERKHGFVSRQFREEIWRFYQSEREQSDYRTFWKDRRVSVIIQCKDRGLFVGGIKLSCVASRVGDKSKLRGDVIGSPALLPVGERFFHYRYALTKLGLRLADKKADPGKISKTFIEDRDLGQMTALGRDIGRELRATIEERFRARKELIESQAGMKSVLGRDDKTATLGGSVYELRGDFRWMDANSARLSARLIDSATRESVRSVSIDLERYWLPKNLLERKTSHYTATARAVTSESLDAQSAKLAVKNLARAVVVSDALGVPPPVITEIRAEAHGVEALRHALLHGVPKDERFLGPRREGDDRWTTELRARVVKLGTAVKPRFTAKLERNAVRTGENIRLELSARETLHVAAFAWGADGNVIRLYPNPYERNPGIPANGRLRLPRDERCPITSAPLEGKDASHEALIVIAGRERLAFDKLAPAFCYDRGSGNPGVPVSGDVFLNALAGLDLTSAGIAVLPYRVRR